MDWVHPHPWGGGVLNKVLYGEALSGGSNPSLLIYQFLPKWYREQNLHPFAMSQG